VRHIAELCVPVMSLRANTVGSMDFCIPVPQKWPPTNSLCLPTSLKITPERMVCRSGLVLDGMMVGGAIWVHQCGSSRRFLCQSTIFDRRGGRIHHQLMLTPLDSQQGCVWGPWWLWLCSLGVQVIVAAGFSVPKMHLHENAPLSQYNPVIPSRYHESLHQLTHSSSQPHLGSP
jgi:hypothetical protein